jgi:hypothetical protein
VVGIFGCGQRCTPEDPWLERLASTSASEPQCLQHNYFNIIRACEWLHDPIQCARRCNVLLDVVSHVCHDFTLTSLPLHEVHEFD